MTSWNDRRKKHPQQAKAERLAHDYTRAAKAMHLKVDKTIVAEADPDVPLKEQVIARFRKDGCTCNPEISQVARPEDGITVIGVAHERGCKMGEPTDKFDLNLFGDVPEAS